MSKVFQPLTIDDLLAYPDPEWLIQGILPATALAQIHGRDGECKTFIALEMAFRIATGMPWFHGQPTQVGKIMYVVGENVPGFKKRLAAWLNEHNPDKHTLQMLRENFTAVGEPVQLADTEHLIGFAETIRDVWGEDEQGDLIVIDTLARCIEGVDEDKASGMGPIIGVMDSMKLETGATVLMLHHTPYNDKSRGRGSSAVPGALDTNIGVAFDKGTKVITVQCTKQKNWAEFDQFQLLLHSTGPELDAPAVLRDLPRGRSLEQLDAMLAENQQKALEILRTFCPNGATYGEWSKECSRVELMGESSFNSARKALLEKGRVKHLDDKYLEAADSTTSEHNLVTPLHSTHPRGVELWSRDAEANGETWFKPRPPEERRRILKEELRQR